MTSVSIGSKPKPTKDFTSLKEIVNTLEPTLRDKVMLADKMLTRGVVQALKHQPFFSTGMYGMPIIIALVGTGCTDGKRQWYDPNFVVKLSDGQTVFLLTHEVMHKYSFHHTRRGKRDPKLWNIAGDYVINLQIFDAMQEEIARRGRSCIEMIPNILLDERFRNMSTEQVYKILEQEQPVTPTNPDDGTDIGNGDCEGDGDGHNGGQLGDVIDCPVNDGQTMADEEHEVEIEINQAYQTAKSRGLQPAFSEGMIDDFKKPKVDWRDVLRNLMQTVVKTDYTWTRPNTKVWSQGIYIPSHIKENMGELVVAIDTSASVSNEETSQFLGEIHSISEELQPEKLHVVWCDTRVQRVDTYEMGDEFKTDKVIFGGGTDFEPVFKWVNEQDFSPMALVYLTDGECPMPNTKVDCPVFWAMTNEDNPCDLVGDGVLHIDFKN
jgi:predicted metal-dependent peptidase